MGSLNRRQFLKLGTVVIATALLDGSAAARGSLSWLRPSPVHSDPPGPLADVRPAKIKRGQLVLTGADFRRGQLEGLTLSNGEMKLLRRQEGLFTSAILEAPLPFGAVGPHWKGTLPVGAATWIEIRTSVDGQRWGPWQPLELETPFDSAPGAEYVGQLASGEMEGQLSRFVQFRIGMSATASSVPSSVSRLTLTFIDATDGPTTADALSAQGLATSDLLLTQDVVNKPPVVSRTAWGCPDGQSSPGWPCEYQTVTHLAIHHTATTNYASDWAYWVRNIWCYHAIDLAWGDIGYNYLIDPNGVIYEGRAGGDDVIAGHVGGFNAGTMGVACIGTYSTVGISSAARTSLERLLAWKCSQRGLDPLGSRSITGYTTCVPLTINHPTISGHRDFPGHSAANPYVICNGYGYTSCPGDALEAAIPSIRVGTSNLVNPPDATPPVATMNPLSRYVKTTSITVSWSATDDRSGVKAYHVQYKVGSGQWTDWPGLVWTTSTQATFSGQHGTTYYFRCRAKDNAENIGNWSNEVSTTVDTAAPSCGMVDLSSPPSHTWFIVETWGWDALSGVKAYDLDYRDRPIGGSWGNWRTWIRNSPSGQPEGTTGFHYGHYLFEGVAGRQYEFRVRAYDYAGNVSDGGGWSSDTTVVTAGSDPSGLYRVRLPFVSKNASP